MLKCWHEKFVIDQHKYITYRSKDEDLTMIYIYIYMQSTYRQQIKDPSTRKIPLSAHLSECAGNKDNYFTLFPFYKFPINATEQHRIIKEAEFIRNTSLN